MIRPFCLRFMSLTPSARQLEVTPRERFSKPRCFSSNDFRDRFLPLPQECLWMEAPAPRGSGGPIARRGPRAVHPPHHRPQREGNGRGLAAV
jgi:hypothetical protein